MGRQVGHERLPTSTLSEAVGRCIGPSQAFERSATLAEAMRSDADCCHRSDGQLQALLTTPHELSSRESPFFGSVYCPLEVGGDVGNALTAAPLDSDTRPASKAAAPSSNLPPMLPTAPSILIGLLQTSSSLAPSPTPSTRLTLSLACSRLSCAVTALVDCEAFMGKAVVVTSWRWLPRANGMEDLIEIDSLRPLDEESDLHSQATNNSLLEWHSAQVASAHRVGIHTIESELRCISPVFADLGNTSLALTVDGHQILLRGTAYADWHNRLSNRHRLASGGKRLGVKFERMSRRVLFKGTARQRRVYSPTAASTMTFTYTDATSKAPLAAEQRKRKRDLKTEEDGGAAGGWWCDYIGELTSIMCNGLLLILDGGVRALMTHYPSVSRPQGVRIGATLKLTNIFCCGRGGDGLGGQASLSTASCPAHFLVAASRTEVHVLHFSLYATPQHTMWSGEEVVSLRGYCDRMSSWRAMVFVETLHWLRVKYRNLCTRALSKTAIATVAMMLGEWQGGGGAVQGCRDGKHNARRSTRSSVDVYSEFFDGVIDRLVHPNDSPPPVAMQPVCIPTLEAVHASLQRDHAGDGRHAHEVPVLAADELPGVPGGGIIIGSLRDNGSSSVFHDDTRGIPARIYGTLHPHMLGFAYRLHNARFCVTPDAGTSVHVAASDMHPIASGGADADVSVASHFRNLSVVRLVGYHSQECGTAHGASQKVSVFLRVADLGISVYTNRNMGTCGARAGGACTCACSSGVNASVVLKCRPSSQQTMPSRVWFRDPVGEGMPVAHAIVEIADPPSGLLATLNIGEKYLVPDIFSDAAPVPQVFGSDIATDRKSVV